MGNGNKLYSVKVFETRNQSIGATVTNYVHNKNYVFYYATNLKTANNEISFEPQRKIFAVNSDILSTTSLHSSSNIPRQTNQSLNRKKYIYLWGVIAILTHNIPMLVSWISNTFLMTYSSGEKNCKMIYLSIFSRKHIRHRVFVSILRASLAHPTPGFIIAHFIFDFYLFICVSMSIKRFLSFCVSALT